MRAFVAALMIAMAGLWPATLWAAPDITALAAAFAKRLDTEIGNLSDPTQVTLISMVDKQLKAEFLDELTRFADKELPKGGDPAFVNTFIDNTRAMIGSLDLDRLNEIRKARAFEPDLQAGYQKSFRTMLQSVAFFTLASDEVMKRDPASLMSTWTRRDAPRLWDTSASGAEQRRRWDEAQAKSAAFRTARENESNFPAAAFYRDAAGLAASAAIDRIPWVDHYEARLKRLYGDLRTPPDPNFFRDLAHLQYVMTGVTLVNGEVRRVGLIHLQDLERRLQPQTQADGTYLTAPLSQDVMRATEIARGFRPDAPVPMGLLPGTDFEDMIAAGYMPDDQGAGAVHGTSTHSLQLAAFMSYHDTFPEELSRSPVELFTAIGAYDGAPTNEVLFGVERPVHSIWGGILDLSSGNDAAPDMSHPDQVREMIRKDSATDDDGFSSPALPWLGLELLITYDTQRKRSKELFEIYETDQLSPELPRFQTRERMAALVDAQTKSAAFSATDPVKQEFYRALFADHLRVFEVMDQRVKDQGYKKAKMADQTGTQRDVNVLTNAADIVLKRGRSDPEAVAALGLEKARRAKLIADKSSSAPVPTMVFEFAGFLTDTEDDEIAGEVDLAPRVDDDADAVFDADGLGSAARKARVLQVAEAVGQPPEAAPAPPAATETAPPAHDTAPGEHAMTKAERDEADRRALQLAEEQPERRAEDTPRARDAAFAD